MCAGGGRGNINIQPIVKSLKNSVFLEGLGKQAGEGRLRDYYSKIRNHKTAYSVGSLGYKS